MENENIKPTARESYKALVSQFVKDLQSDQKPWRKTWAVENGIPKSAITGNNYSGINVLSLMMNNPYSSNEWITKNQIEKLGGSVKPEELENGRDIYFLKDVIQTVEKVDEQTGETIEEEVKRTILRSYKVFNAIEQTQGVNFAKEEKAPKHERLLEVDKFIASTKAEVYTGEPAYSPKDDAIFIPHIDSFEDKENYYSAFFHELSHWTGHETRLNRLKHNSKYGDDQYAYEELVAELSSAFLCADHSISMDTTMHGEYLSSWIQMLNKNPYILFSVASQSSKATHYLNKLSQKNMEQDKKKRITKSKTTVPKVA